jgi:hypothetical protein
MWPIRKSILDGSKFEKMVRGVFDSTLTVKIASGRGEERLVVILTTNLDVGLAQFWDLGYQIEGLEPEAAATRIQDLILASTALPVALPAREIDGALHADGAIAASMFLGIDYEGFLWLLDQWHRRQPTRPFPQLRFWIIVNSKLFVEPLSTQPRYPDVAFRSIEIALEYDRLKSLSLALMVAANIDAIEGVEVEMRYVMMPDDAILPKELNELADQEIANNMVDLGIQVGRDTSNWRSDLPEVHMLPESAESTPPDSSPTPENSATSQ